MAHYQKLTTSTIERAIYWGEMAKELLDFLKSRQMPFKARWTGFDEKTLGVLESHLAEMRREATREYRESYEINH